MKIHTVILALIVFAVAPGWANAADTDDQDGAAVQTAVAEQEAASEQDSATATDRKKNRDRADTRRGKEQKTAKADDEDDWDPDEVTCKRFAETGSRIKKRYCATNQAWKEMAESGNNTVEWLKRQGALRN